MASIKSRLRLSPEAAEYVQQLQAQRNQKTRSKTIEEILLEHKHQNEINQQVSDTTTKIMDHMHQKVEQEMHDHFQRLQRGVNNTDRHSQVILEVLNGLMIYSDIPHMMTTSDYESPTLTTAREEVNDRIAHQKQRKDDAKNKRWDRS
jgi:hypothetical protein